MPEATRIVIVVGASASRIRRRITLPRDADMA